MSGDKIIEYMVGAVGTTFILIVVIYFLNALATSPAALQPGDPFYHQQHHLTKTVATIIPWLAPGALGAAVVIIATFRDGFGR